MTNIVENFARNWFTW